MSGSSNREFIERAQETMDRLEHSGGRLNARSAMVFLDYVVLIGIRERLAELPWWQFWTWPERVRLRRRMRELSAHYRGPVRRADQCDQGGLK